MSESETRRIARIQTDIETKNEPVKKHRLPDVRVIIMAASILLLLMLILFLLLSRRLSMKGPKGPFQYVRDDSVSYSLGMGENSAYAAHRNGLAAVTDAGFTLLDENGSVLGTVQHTYAAPLLLSGDRLAVACDIGGSRLSVLDKSGKTVMDLVTDGTLLDADISGDDAVCYAELIPGYKAVLTVYDEKQNQIYRWYSASRYMNQCAVSEDAKILCAVALGEEETRFQSSAVLFETDMETPSAEVPLGDQLIWDLQFMDETVLCAVGESSAVFFTAVGEALGEYSFGEQYLLDYSTDGDGFTALILNKYQAGNSNTIVTLDPNGRKLAERYLGEEVLSVHAAGDCCAVLTPECLYVYDKNLKLCASQAQTASAAVIFADGSAILVEEGVGTRYLPE